MTTPVHESFGSSEPTPTVPPRRRAGVAEVLRDLLIVGGWFAGAGLVGGFVWVHAVDLPQVTRAAGAATVPSEELVKQVAMDGWFAVIALVGGLVSGILLLAWRRRDPLLSVGLVALGGGLASWLMVQVGKALGPDNAIAALRKLPDGSHVSEQLRLHAPGVAWVWPIAAAFGALVYLWVLAKPGAPTEPPG
jgi:hypothetical protein